jgi:LAO/AO transport system kinase
VPTQNLPYLSDMSEEQSRERARERIRAKRVQDRDVEDVFQRLIAGDREALAHAITEVERTLPAARQRATALLELCLPYAGKSRRIGITGVPGVGKSTFIERFGQALTAQGQRVAVLAIDPSSRKTGGSILGDKTRMEQLARDPLAFIRPSPAAETLGGVARATRESIMLCEAAGYTTIVVETVGVGQSETAVHGMVDFFLLLMLAGAGDELQGIKRGIMEMADALFITKADGNNIAQTQLAKMQYENALHLFPAAASGWTPVVGTCSALENSGMNEVHAVIDRYFSLVSASGWMEGHRREQDLLWMEEALYAEITRELQHNQILQAQWSALKTAVIDRQKSPFAAAHELVNLWLKRH